MNILSDLIAIYSINLNLNKDRLVCVKLIMRVYQYSDKRVSFMLECTMLQMNKILFELSAALSLICLEENILLLEWGIKSVQNFYKFKLNKC